MKATIAIITVAIGAILIAGCTGTANAHTLEVHIINATAFTVTNVCGDPTSGYLLAYKVIENGAIKHYVAPIPAQGNYIQGRLAGGETVTITLRNNQQFEAIEKFTFLNGVKFNDNIGNDYIIV